MSERLTVLCWHNVNGTWSFPARPGAGIAGLAQQLRALRRFATVVPLESALEKLFRGQSLPPRAVALTFDDGYRDNLTLALPMLEALGLPATFFLVPGLLSDGVAPWWETVSRAITSAATSHFMWGNELLPLASVAQRRRARRRVEHDVKELSHAERVAAVEQLRDELRPTGPAISGGELFMDWDSAKQLVERGFTVGSHTCRHAILSRESASAQVADLAASRRVLQDKLSVSADVLAYPNGRKVDYNDHTLAAARAAGHRWALTTNEGVNRPDTPPLEIRRVVIYPERSVLDLLAALRHLPLDR